MNLDLVIFLVANFHHFVKKGPNDMVKSLFWKKYKNFVIF
jgi:hypothetical protein